jgi:hypothetical protein
MDLVFLPAAFAGTYFATSRSLARGFLAMFAVGYFSGVVRANFMGVFTSFMFDAAVLGLYLGFFLGRSSRAAGVWSGPAGHFVIFLIAWPTLLSFVPVNHYLVQLVGVRSSVWLLPIMLLSSRLTAADLDVISRGLAILNLAALAGGVYVFQFGVEALYPINAITKIIYNSNDVAGYKYHRIPSIFLNAHSYGGTMLYTLPLLLDRTIGTGVRLVDRGLAAVGIVAAAGGLLMCGARLPLIMLALMLVVAWALTRFSLKLGLFGAILVGGGLMVAGTNERFQRVSNLEKTDEIVSRVASSANSSFLELLMDYPMGAGMGSAGGTSIPFFLADVAPEQIALENEYGRILIDQGLIGLGGWLAFIMWIHVRPPRAQPPAPWRLGSMLMYSLTLTIWMTAFIGSGTLTSIPGSALILMQMGVLAGVRERGSVLGPVDADPKPDRLILSRRRSGSDLQRPSSETST